MKIDQGFVADLVQDDASKAIVSAVIQLAHRLKMTVIAEDVENAAQRLLLASLGCDQCQGFHFAVPQAADELDLLIQQQVVGGTVHLPALAPAANS